MSESHRRSWTRAVLLVGVGYAVIGVVSAAPATHVQTWRLAAWVLSAVAFGGHIAYERFRLRRSPGPAALHVAFAVALGAFLLAVNANIHSLSVRSTAPHRQLLLLSIGIWPVAIAAPAFLAAFVGSVVLERVFRRPEGQRGGPL